MKKGSHVTFLHLLLRRAGTQTQGDVAHNVFLRIVCLRKDLFQNSEIIVTCSNDGHLKA